MIIECPMCRTRFRLDEGKIKGRGARIRCRRCGEAIVVLKPEEETRAPSADAGGGLLDLRTVVRESLGDAPAPPPPPGIDEPATASGATVAAAPPEFPPPAEREAAGAAEVRPASLPDLTVDFRPEEKIDFAPAAERPKEEAPADFLIGGMETMDFLKGEPRKEEKFDISPSLRQEPREPVPGESMPEPLQMAAAEASAAEPPPTAPPELRVAEPGTPPAPPESWAVPESARRLPAGARKPASPLLRPTLVVLLLLFVAIAGGGAYLGFTQNGQELLRGLIPGMESLWLRSGARPGPQFDVRNLIGYYETGTVSGNLFVIKGQVANMGRNRKSGIRVRATLLDGKEQTVAERTVYAGNVLAGDTLRTASRGKIEEALSNRFGDKLVNMDIAPGKSVPFMVVFFNAPEGVSAYRLEAKDGE